VAARRSMGPRYRFEKAIVRSATLRGWLRPRFALEEIKGGVPAKCTSAQLQRRTRPVLSKERLARLVATDFRPVRVRDRGACERRGRRTERKSVALIKQEQRARARRPAPRSVRFGN